MLEREAFQGDPDRLLGPKMYERLDDRQIENIFDIIQANNIHEAILQSPDFSFDWHGDSILRALKNEPLARMFGR